MDAPRIHEEEVCAIDFGSKNFKFVTGRQTADGTQVDLLKKEAMGLGQDLARNNGRISGEKLDHMAQVLGDFRAQCDHRGIGTILGIGTSAMRSARNRAEVVDLITSFGIRFEVAHGKREGDVSYMAVTGGAPNRLVCDMGSRSFQISHRRHHAIKSISLKSGYMLAYQRFFRDDVSFSKSRKRFRELLQRRVRHIPRHTEQFIALATNTMAAFVVGGTKADVVNRDLTRKALHHKIDELRHMPRPDYHDLRLSTPKIEKILPGMVFIEHLMDRSHHHAVRVAEVELPAGLIVEYFANGASRDP